MPETTIRAAAVLMVSLMLVIICSIVLSITEESAGFNYTDILFETVSAFATVGLSRGLTPYLSDVGKIMLTIVMLIGRVGPMTVAYAFLKQNRNIGNYTYPEGKVIIG